MTGRLTIGAGECGWAARRERSLRDTTATIAGILIALLVVTAGCGGGGSDPFAKRSGDGSSDPFGGLGDEITFEAYRIRPPKNLPRQEVSNPSPSIKIAAWTEAPPEARPSPGMLMICMPNPSNLTTTPPMWQRGVQNSLQAFKRMFDDVKQVAGNRLQVNGLEGYRAEFTAETADSDAVSGVVLMVLDDKNVLACVAIGLGKNAGDAVASLEKSLMTINRPGYLPPKDALWDPPPGASPGIPLGSVHVEMIKTYGLDRIAIITAIDVPFSREKVVEKAVREAAGANALVFSKDDTTARMEDAYRSDGASRRLVLVAPVDDVAGLAEKLDLGQVTMVNQDNRTFTLRIDEDKIPSIQEEFAERAGLEMKYGEHGRVAGMPSKNKVVSDPNDPEFFKQNLAVLKSGDTFGSDKALKLLVSADTSKLNDPEMRKQIAQAIRAVAFDDSAMSDDRKAAIRGLVHWGGKFAGPVLVQLLQTEPSFVEDEIYKQLALLKEPSAIDLLVRKLMEGGHAADGAAQCLAQYGPIAEDSVLANTQATNFIVTRKIVQVLAQIGTKKSVPILKSLRRLSFYNMIASDVQYAVQMIEQREKAK